jgi:DNA-binding response OmpR family regulator
MDAALPQPRILIVEDDEAIGDAMEFHLAHAGMRTNLVSDGLAGMRALSADVPDVLILDLMLPHLDGCSGSGRTTSWRSRSRCGS